MIWLGNQINPTCVHSVILLPANLIKVV